MKKLFYLPGLALLLSLYFGCSNNASKQNGKPEIADNGVHIDYTDTGTGDTTLLFVHGWSINKTYWANQVAYFGKKYRVVTVDLPGFGLSGKNRTDWSTGAYGRDIDSVMVKLNLKQVILVGHSMAGNIVLQAALNASDRVIGVTGVDNFKNVGAVQTEESKLGFAQAIDQLKHNFKQVASMYFNAQLFTKTTPDTIKKRILNDVAHADTTIAVATMVQGNNFNEVAKLKQYHHKLYLVNSDYTPTDTASLRKNNIPFMVTYVHATGHFPMAEKPQDFNICLEKVIADIKAAKKE